VNWYGGQYIGLSITIVCYGSLYISNIMGWYPVFYVVITMSWYGGLYMAITVGR
jgi:hypothetical protein